MRESRFWHLVGQHKPRDFLGSEKTGLQAGQQKLISICLVQGSSQVTGAVRHHCLMMNALEWSHANEQCWDGPVF